MSIKPYPVNVYRKDEWISVNTDELLPGDLVSISELRKCSKLIFEFYLT